MLDCLEMTFIFEILEVTALILEFTYILDIL